MLTAFGLGAVLVFAVWVGGGVAAKPQSILSQGAYTGSQSCRECHERFYQLWATSHHGTAMREYSDAFAEANLTAQPGELNIKSAAYQAQTGPGQGWVREKAGQAEKRYPIKYALGGKNIFYFLTPMDKGRLQTLPLAYDINKKQWFDTAQSGIRHAGDRPVDWRDSTYTFNTSCHGCHVSQYSLNYDLESGVYRTTWKEPGINCETCHGPAEEHIRVCRQAPKGTVPKDLAITRGGRDFSHRQNNDTCSTCHAKAIPLTQSFLPGDDFWDHYDMALLEHSDYHPDGRDLGENYTYTLWLMSPCAKSGQLDCLHCHTSSGRFRQKKDPNQACASCHAERVRNAAAHTRHKEGSSGNQCISCHMPMTNFAGMNRTDHSMLPPTPVVTLRLKSPNACNLCHQGKDAAWADKLVRAWHKDDYQAQVLHRAELIQAARQDDWRRLPEMLAYITSRDRDEVFAASLIRLIRACPDEVKWQAVLKASADPSPLVRAAALASLQDWPTRRAAQALLPALKDERLLVRVRAAQSLAGYPARALSDEQAAALEAATQEMLRSLLARPDTWHAHYNVGNYYLERGMLGEAVHSYQVSLELEPRAMMPMVNLAMAYARSEQPEKAQQALERALRLEPANAAANFNMGLLKAEQGDEPAAERYLSAAVEADPKMSRAGYNLSLLLHRSDPQKAMELARAALEYDPNPRYAFTLAYFMNQAGDRPGAAKELTSAIERWPWYADSYLLLADIRMADKQRAEAVALLQSAVAGNALAPGDRRRLRHKLIGLQTMVQD